MLETFYGPLGSHRNYIAHIALSNHVDYLRLKKNNQEEARSATPIKYNEFRLFLNAVESFNNIADYFYFEYEDRISYRTVDEFRAALHKKYPELAALAELANAYKHCVRARKDGTKNAKLPWARDLQKPNLTINIELGEKLPTAKIEYEFPWPIKEHEATLEKVFSFWFRYHNAPFTNELINL